jgi:chaperonin GroES
MLNLSELNMVERPRFDRIVILPLVKATTSLLIDMEEGRMPERGVVIALGPGGTAPETGRPVEIMSAVGELVRYGKYAGQDFDIDTPKGPVKAIIMRDCEVLLAQEAGTYELEIHDGDVRKMHLKGFVCGDCPRADLSAERERLRAERAPAQADTDALIEQERERLAASGPRLVSTD